MIHFVTVHHRSARWVDIQADALRRTIIEPYTVHGCLEDVPEETAGQFDTVLWMEGDHAPKLNALAARIDAPDDDLLVFLDGDAWPVADPIPTVRSELEAGSLLVAVRRDEAAGTRGPHPCFTATTVGWWRRSHARWGGRDLADINDTVTALLTGCRWTPLTRLNRWNPHPQFFGLYGIAEPLVYHHGAGFRTPYTRLDHQLSGRTKGGPRRRTADNVALSAEWHAKAADPEFWRALA